MSTDKAEMEAIDKEMVDAQSRFDVARKKYEPLISSDAERALYASFSKKWDAYLELHSQGLVLSRANKNGEAAALFKGAQGKAFADAGADLLKLVEINNNGAVAATAEAAADYAAARMLVFIFVCVGVVFALGAIAFVFFGVIRPMGALNKGIMQLAEGNFDIVIPGIGRKDEIGEIARSTDAFKLKLGEKMQLEAEQTAEKVRLEAEAEKEQADVAEAAQAERRAREAELAAMVDKVVTALGRGLEDLSKGDLTCRLTEEFSDEYKKVQNDFNGTIGRLQETIHAIASSAREVSSAAAEISTSTSDLSQRTEEQAAGLEQTSASMEELSATVKKNSENAQQANQLTASTRDIATRGGEVVGQTVKAMARIAESSHKIADIIGVIDEIARQTNLLALNAAVEAARAGDAGRGFAVVASEVRSLAQRSSQAAKDIKDLITNSSSEVKEGVELANRAGTSLAEITASIQQVADLVADIANASVEQTAGIDQINKALSQMDEVTQQNSALVEENAAAAKTLEDQSGAMGERVGFFRIVAGNGAESARSAELSQPSRNRARARAAG
jgi:methyl-accepting chemotaxis protein